MNVTKLDKTPLFINLKREALFDEECDLCGETNLDYYWKCGNISIVKRAAHLCERCHKVIYPEK